MLIYVSNEFETKCSITKLLEDKYRILEINKSVNKSVNLKFTVNIYQILSSKNIDDTYDNLFTYWGITIAS